MAKSDNPLLKNTSGKIGGSFVVKQYSYGTVISAVPDMKRVKKANYKSLNKTGLKML